MRVQIYNTQKIASPANQALEPVRDLSRFAIARPLYGTTLTHYALLWQRWGREKTIAWHRDWRARGVRELNGNAAVKDAVAEGVCDAGFTDTDDFFEAKDAGKPVAMQPVQLEDGATICIPNTVAIVRGTRRENDAHRLVDFLLSAETELALARSKSRQIPLGPVPADQVPAEVRELQAAAQRGAPLTNLLPARNECLAWLKAEELK
jgi:iron(III) transport system substrate-binding protein